MTLSKRLAQIDAPVRITLVYILIGGLWIVLSDHGLATLIADRDILTEIQTLKGWFFIFLTALVLYGLIRRDFKALEKSRRALEYNYDVTLAGWVRALDLRDHETEHHTQRVTALTLRIVREMGVPESEYEHIRRGGLLHDIGKMGVPDHILLKPGKLTEQEWNVMRQHPTYTQEWLAPIDYLRPALAIPFYHHERWDGSGYPQGLRGEEIPLAARIFAVADVWDALTTDRPYRKAWSRDNVIDYLRAQAGVQFDPQVIDTFLRVVASDGAPTV